MKSSPKPCPCGKPIIGKRAGSKYCRECYAKKYPKYRSGGVELSIVPIEMVR